MIGDGNFSVVAYMDVKWEGEEEKFMYYILDAVWLPRIAYVVWGGPDGTANLLFGPEIRGFLPQEVAVRAGVDTFDAAVKRIHECMWNFRRLVAEGFLEGGWCRELWNFHMVVQYSFRPELYGYLLART